MWKFYFTRQQPRAGQLGDWTASDSHRLLIANCFPSVDFILASSHVVRAREVESSIPIVSCKAGRVCIHSRSTALYRRDCLVVVPVPKFEAAKYVTCIPFGMCPRRLTVVASLLVQVASEIRVALVFLTHPTINFTSTTRKARECYPRTA